MKKLLLLLVLPFILISASMPMTSVRYYPNLRMDPSIFLHNSVAVVTDPNTGKKYLNMPTAGANMGPGHLMIIGDRPTGTGKFPATQAVWDSNEGWVCFEKGAAGEFVMGGHGDHQRWHWDSWGDFAIYKMAGPNSGVFEGDRKMVYCLQPSMKYKYRWPDAGQPNARKMSYLNTNRGIFPFTCGNDDPGAKKLGQRLPNGTTDVYYPVLNETHCALPLWGDGVYALIGVMDPDEKVIEWNEEDNWGFAVVEIRGDNIKVLFLVEPGFM